MWFTLWGCEASFLCLAFTSHNTPDKNVIIWTHLRNYLNHVVVEIEIFVVLVKMKLNVTFLKLAGVKETMVLFLCTSEIFTHFSTEGETTSTLKDNQRDIRRDNSPNIIDLSTFSNTDIYPTPVF